MRKTLGATRCRRLPTALVMIAVVLAGSGMLCSVAADEGVDFQPAVSVDESAIALEVRQALATMLQLLENGEDEQFVFDHAPGETYGMLQQLLADGRSIPRFSPRQRRPIIDYVKSMQQMDLIVRPNGLCVALIPPAPTGEDEDNPAAKNLYAKMTATGIAGYGDQLPLVIKLALADLVAGESEDFAGKMFPPSTTAMIKTENRWDHVVKQLASGTAQNLAMQKDLQLIQALKPKINGTTAVYTLDRIATAFPQRVTRLRFGAPRRSLTPKQPASKQPATSSDGKREIRFSLIDGHWRFYDNTSQLASKIAEALNQKISAARDAENSQNVLVKVGKTWRLQSLTGGQN
ncbi:MAG: hypothetical protein ABJZ55_09295 [Fuerstiella sp.]